MIYEPRFDHELTAAVFCELADLWIGLDIGTSGDTPTGLLLHCGLVETQHTDDPYWDKLTLTAAGQYVCRVIFGFIPSTYHVEAVPDNTGWVQRTLQDAGIEP